MNPSPSVVGRPFVRLTAAAAALPAQAVRILLPCGSRAASAAETGCSAKTSHRQPRCPPAVATPMGTGAVT